MYVCQGILDVNTRNSSGRGSTSFGTLDTWIDLAKYIYVTRQNYIQVKISQPRLILNFLCLLALLIMN